MAPVVTHPRILDLASSDIEPMLYVSSPVGFSVFAMAVPVLGEQAYFWTPLWQQWEGEATEDLRFGRYAEFRSISELIDDLERGSTD